MNENPPPGFYNIEQSLAIINPRSQAAYIKEDCSRQVRRELLPDAGMYEPSKPFGADLNNITIGGKYKEEMNENPPPGFYDPDDAIFLTKPGIQSAFIKENVGFKREPDVTPDGGMYEPHEPFGLIP